jgi:hypothetical protein
MNRLSILIAACTFVSTPLSAQDTPWRERIVLTVNVPFQALDDDFSETLIFADTVRRAENVDFRMRYPSTRGAMFDAGVAIRLRSNLGAGVVASWAERSSAGSFGLKLPNPLVANSPLELQGTIDDLGRNELGIHLHALYARALGRNVRVMLAAGPSIFRTKQDLVRSVDVDILPGFRSLAFDEAALTTQEQTSFGFNVGADLTWAFARHLGVGTVTRYSRANVTWHPPSSSGVARDIESHAGGLHVGGGIRMLF